MTALPPQPGRRRRAVKRAAVRGLTTLALVLLCGAWHELPVHAGPEAPRPWPRGELTWWDASGSRATIAAAANGWNRSGVRVHLRRARSREEADVVFVADREQLRERCGRQCLGLSSTIGRPDGERAVVWLHPQLTGAPGALSVWVAMHELGHVLGLHHREGGCSLMNAQAFADACTFPAGRDDGPLPCGPDHGDVAAAALLYGRDEHARPCR